MSDNKKAIIIGVAAVGVVAAGAYLLTRKRNALQEVKPSEPEGKHKPVKAEKKEEKKVEEPPIAASPEKTKEEPPAPTPPAAPKAEAAPKVPFEGEIAKLFDGAELMTGKGDTVPADRALGGKVFGIYFSAHWCGPCRAFTPVLKETYNNLKAAGKDFEIVFVSGDKEAGSFSKYFEEMPWLALPFDDRGRAVALNKHFKVQGIPTLVLVDEQGTVITTRGREAVAGDPAGAGFPWKPLPPATADSPVAALEARPFSPPTLSMIAFCEGLPADKQAEVEAALEPLAGFAFAVAVDGEEPTPRYYIAKAPGPEAKRLRQCTGLPESGGPFLILLDEASRVYYKLSEGVQEVTSETVGTLLEIYPNLPELAFMG